jgi:hypothetical protein
MLRHGCGVGLNTSGSAESQCKGSRHAMALIFSLTRLGGREARRRSILAIGVQFEEARIRNYVLPKSRLDLSRTCVFPCRH